MNKKLIPKHQTGNKFINRKDVPIVDKLLDYKVKLMRKIYKLGNGFEWNTPYDVQKDKYEDVALDTYLFNRNLQKKAFLNNGYIEGITGDYGLVSKAVGNRNLPIYLKNKDDISRSDLKSIGNIYGNHLFNNKDLVHSGNSPSVIYTDSIGNIYFKKYDLHDYGTTSSNRYSNPILKIASNLLDFVGNPVVLTTGIVKLDNKRDVLNLLLYVKKSGDINLYNSIINNYNKEPYKTIYNSYIERRAYEIAPLYLRDKVDNGEYKEFNEFMDKLKKEIPMDSINYTKEDLKRYGIIQFKNGGIHIKKKNRGKFTKYCNGKVTQECIDKAKRSGNKKLIKRAVFAENSREWAKKHQGGGWLALRIYNSVDPTGNYPSGYREAFLLGLGAIVGGGSKKYEVTDSVADAAWRKRLGLKYDTKFLPDNKDGSVRLPKNLEKEIPVDTTFIKNRMLKNRELRNYYVEDLGRSEDNELIQVIDAANDIDKETLDSLRHTYKTGEWVTINEHGNNSRQLINNGEWKLPNSPLNVLHDFGIRYNKDTRTMEYKDIYNLNEYDWGVPGKAFTIKGTIKLKKQ